MNTNQNQLQTPMEQHKDAIQRVFVIENLQAILAVLHSLRPMKTSLIKEDQFQTVVNAAREDAFEDIMKGVAQFIAENAKIKPSN